MASTIVYPTTIFPTTGEAPCSLNIFDGVEAFFSRLAGS
jgi:hypothetical protein